MGHRITQRDLDGVVARLNRMVGVPEHEERREPTEQERAAGILYPSTVGRYYWSGAYGGVELQQVVNYGGGVRSVLHTGHVSRREAYQTACAYADGLADSMAADESTVRPSARAGIGTITARADQDLQDNTRRVAAIREARERAGVEA